MWGQVYTDVGLRVYGYRVRLVHIQVQNCADVGSDVGVQVDGIKTRVESAYGVCNQRLKLKDDKLLSTLALRSNMRRYLWGLTALTGLNLGENQLTSVPVELGRQELTLVHYSAQPEPFFPLSD